LMLRAFKSITFPAFVLRQTASKSNVTGLKNATANSRCSESTRRKRLLHFCSICAVKERDCEFPVISIAKTRCRESLCSLFSIDRRLPKLNVADLNSKLYEGVVCDTCDFRSGASRCWMRCCQRRTQPAHFAHRFERNPRQSFIAVARVIDLQINATDLANQSLMPRVCLDREPCLNKLWKQRTRYRSWE
jgi:hypothetical protein